MIESQGVDNARNFISNADGSPNRTNIENWYYMALLRIGFSWQQITLHSRGYMRDIVNMHEDLTGEGYELILTPNLKDYHDYLMGLSLELEEHRDRIRNAVDAEWQERDDDIQNSSQKTRRRYELGYKEINTSEQMPFFETENLIFRSPKNTNELIEVGRKMNICVGQYRSDFFLGKLDIVLVTKIQEDSTEKYISCLEVKRRSLVQAKMNSNRAALRSLPLMKAIKKWAIEHKIKLACSDVGKKDYWIDDDLPRKDRIAFLDGDSELLEVTEEVELID